MRLADMDSQLTMQMKGGFPLQHGMMTYNWRMHYSISLKIRDHHIGYIRKSRSQVAGGPFVRRLTVTWSSEKQACLLLLCDIYLELLCSEA